MLDDQETDRKILAVRGSQSRPALRRGSLARGS
ncbi:MAG: hypothetical protein ACRD45_05960 [Bryobacteraceae bacterium]